MHYKIEIQLHTMHYASPCITRLRLKSSHTMHYKWQRSMPHYSWYQWKWYNLRLTTSQPQTTASLLTHSSRVGQTQRNIDQMRVASVSYQEISTLLVDPNHWRHKQSCFWPLTDHTCLRVATGAPFRQHVSESRVSDFSQNTCVWEQHVCDASSPQLF